MTRGKITIKNANKLYLLELMGTLPTISYAEVARELRKSESTVARWMMEPNDDQTHLVEMAIKNIRERQRNGESG